MLCNLVRLTLVFSLLSATISAAQKATAAPLSATRAQTGRGLDSGKPDSISASSQSVNKAIKKSQELLDSGDLRGAEEVAFRAYQSNSQNDECALNLADIYLDGRKKQLARPLIVEVLRRSPRSVQASVLYARYYNMCGRPQQAIEAAKYAISIDGKCGRAYYFMARAQRVANLPAYAASLKQALVLDPNLAQAWAFLATIKLKEGKYDEAVGCYEKAAKIRPRYPEYPFNIGVVYYQRGALDKAREAYLKVTKNFPKYENAYINLGVMAGEEQKLGEAERYFRKATEVAPLKPRGWAELTGALVAQTKYEEAIITARRATLLAPELADCRFALGVAQFGLDMMPQAQQNLEKAVQLQFDKTKKMRYQHFLVVVMFMNGKSDEALKLAEAVYKANPNDIYPRRSMAWALMCLKKYEGGFVILRKALQDDPKNVPLISEYMAGLSSAKRYADASAQARRIVALSPDCSAAWIVILDGARRKKNRPEEAEALAHLKNTHLDSHTLMEIGLDTAGSAAISSTNGVLSRALMQNPDNADLLLNTRDPRENLRGLHSH